MASTRSRFFLCSRPAGGAFVWGVFVLAMSAGALQAQDSATIAQSWHSAPPMLHARSAHAIVGTGDAIYAIGGTGAGGAPVLQVERFDGNEWRDETTLPGEGLNAPAAVAIGQRIYVIGGFKTVTNVPSAEVLVYNVTTHLWSNAAPLPAPRGGHAAIVLGGKIHVIGGGNSRSTLADHSEYDPAVNTWTERAPLPRSEGSPAGVAFNGKLYAIGGRSGGSDFGNVTSMILSPSVGAKAPPSSRAAPPVPRSTVERSTSSAGSRKQRTPC
jgi:hypothetical protein